MSATSSYAPDYFVSPGEVLEETLEARGIPKTDFARRAGLSFKTVSLILAGKAPVLPDTALQFERVLGVSAELWTNRESRYRLALAKQEAKKSDSELAEWARNFPRLELVRRGVVPPEAKGPELGRVLHGFFGVANTEAWYRVYGSLGPPADATTELPAAASFRKSRSVQSKGYLIATWVRLAEIAAQETETAPFDKRSFERAVKEARTLTREDPETFFPRLRDLCARCGVALVLVPAIPGCGVYGVTRWLSKGKAVLALSNLRKSDDQFWFTFFHEAGHLVLHGKDETYIEGCGDMKKDKEMDADEYAREILIPALSWEPFRSAGQFRETDIRRFAENIGIASGIVVGFLQHEKLIKNEWHNGLKRKFEIAQ
jgi:addiction module HigA family antidote